MPKLALHWQILIAMTLGAVVGVVLNLAASSKTATVSLPDGSTLQVQDSTDLIRISLSSGEQTARYIVDPSFEEKGGPNTTVVGSLSGLEEANPTIHDLFLEHGQSPARQIGTISQMLGGLFLRMLKMVSIPLIIFSLITGITGLGSASRLGKMFSYTILYYVSTSLLAIITGLLMVNMIQPGKRGDSAAFVAAMESTSKKEMEKQSLSDVLWNQIETMIPDNPVFATANGEFLSIISFSLLFGIFALIAGGDSLETVLRLSKSGFEVMMRMTVAIIRLAPIGVFFLMLFATATQGIAIFGLLGWYMVAVFLALLIHSMLTLPLILKLVAKRSPIQFARAMSPALFTAFSSASSNGTLPLTLTCVEERAGINNRTSSFVLPLGATINMDGTALYEAVAVLFIAQVYAQVNPEYDLELGRQVLVAFTALLASIGAAGIPHAGLVMMLIILQAVNLPVEMQGLIIAVDRILDMCRTCVNVWSDSCGCAVIEQKTADPATS